MKNLYKAGLLAALGLIGASNAQAQNDLIVGFTTGSGNDFIYDLGSVSSLTPQSWDLSTYLTGALGTSAVQWGVIGDTANKAYGTFGSKPTTLSDADYNNIDTAIATIEANNGLGSAGSHNLVGATTTYGWYNETLNVGVNTDTSAYVNSIPGAQNPNVTGYTSVYLWQQPQFATATQLGQFSLSSGSVLTYSVPEPTSCALFGGAGMLVLAFRNKFRRSLS